MKVAVIGSGIAGLSTCYNLLKSNERENIHVTLFEKERRIGGHSHTYSYKGDKIDLGFQVFNYHTYPNMLKMFDHLGVEIMKSDMSLSVKDSGYEWGSNNYWNLLYPSFWFFLWDMNHFGRSAYHYLARKDMDEKIKSQHTIDDFCELYGVTENLKKYYLIPLIASTWSASVTDSGKFNAYSILRFMDNHKLLSFTKHQWYTMKNRSEEYVQKLIDFCGNNITIETDSKIKFVNRLPEEKNIIVMQNDSSQIFDHVVFAIHGDEVLSFIKDPTPDQEKILGRFKFSKAEVVLHEDPSLMPESKYNWGSWNYMKEENKDQLVCTYWVKNLQGIENENLFVSLNPTSIDETKVVEKFLMTHPKMDYGCILSQKEITDIQGFNNIWYAGAYLINGFHEDGYVSGMQVANKILNNKL